MVQGAALTPQFVKRHFQKAGMRPWHDGEDAAGEHQGWAIWLDDKIWRTPAKKTGPYPSQKLAAAMAEEWNSLPERYNPQSLEICRLAATALDQGAGSDDEIHQELYAIAAGDLLRFHHKNQPELYDKQQQIWQPVLDHFSQSTKISYPIIHDIFLTPLPASSQQSLAEICEGHDTFKRLALLLCTRLTGSFALGFGLLQGWHSAAEALNLAELEALWQEEKWGADEEAAKARADKLTELTQLTRFISYL